MGTFISDNLPLVSGLIGALIGAGASIAGQIIQARFQSKRDRIKLTVETAIADHHHHFEIAQKLGQRAEMMPLSCLCSLSCWFAGPS